VDLYRADLRGEDLSMAYLVEANLRRADLRGANLTEANLGGACLNEANLGRACLSRASLRGATLFEADLRRANLSRAYLGGATLFEANLDEVNLSEADFYNTILSNVGLSRCKNLDSIRHHGPSIIDIPTLQRSGPLPLAFLRGIGLPDTLIEYLPSMLGGVPIQHYSCFISYSSKDDEFVRRLHADLQDNGVRCWFDAEDMKTVPRSAT
jgi:hypothetical protein